MIRCANSGVSGVISTTGYTQIMQDEKGSFFTRGFLLATAKVPLQAQTTLYQRLGDFPVIVAAVLSLLIAVWQGRMRTTAPV
jgi:apolipoprotein N-acyltransferase